MSSYRQARHILVYIMQHGTITSYECRFFFHFSKTETFFLSKNEQTTKREESLRDNTTQSICMSAHFLIMAGTPTMPLRPWLGALVSCERLLYRSFFMAALDRHHQRPTRGIRCVWCRYVVCCDYCCCNKNAFTLLRFCEGVSVEIEGILVCKLRIQPFENRYHHRYVIHTYVSVK